MKKAKKIILVSVELILLVVLAYVTNIVNTPSKLIVFKGENFEYNGMLGLEAKSVNSSSNKKIVETYSTEKDDSKLVDTSEEGESTFSINMFGIKVKEVNVKVIDKTTVIPIGKTIGVKLYTNGVLVIGKSTIEGTDNNLYKPYEKSEIQEGDMIVEVNEKEVTSTDELLSIVESSNGESLSIKYRRGDVINTTNITPIKTSNNEYKLGLWVRDGTAGVGTLTFYEPKTNKFMALGHGIEDVDTEELIEISSGELLLSKIVSITKGEVGSPRRNKRKYSKSRGNRNHI